MLTRLEAKERADKLWSGVMGLRPRANRGGWEVETAEQFHYLDTNGHATCHHLCIEREANLGKPKPQMTQKALSATLAVLLSELRLGERSLDISSTYDDYVAFKLVGIFTLDGDDAKKVREHMRTFCDQHGWTELHVTQHDSRHAITVTMHQSNMIKSADVRMPQG